MSRYEVMKAKTQKNFCRDNFRTIIKVIYFSLLVALLQVAGVYYLFVTKPGVGYYATNSALVGTIVPLRETAGPNPSDRAILLPDPPEEVSVKNLEE